MRVDYYDKNNRLILTIDPAGFAESYTYDAAGNVLSDTRHATRVTLPVDPNVLPTVAANAADKKTSYTYDELDRIATITDGEGYVTSFKYDKVGNQTEASASRSTRPTQRRTRSPASTTTRSTASSPRSAAKAA